jgi:hypothetical protein
VVGLSFPTSPRITLSSRHYDSQDQLAFRGFTS